jgi:succinate dehydrogenase/fumarate reductase cytochrome b subunit
MANYLLAQIRNPVLPPTIGGSPTGADYQQGGAGLGALISQLVGALFMAGFLLALVYLLIGGISWITSGGDKTKLEKARDQITNSIIGIIVVAAAWAISVLVANFFGLDLTKLPIPSIK